ncbi:MAG: translation elongation factor-like protein [Minisyncoccia bacterium]
MKKISKKSVKKVIKKAVKKTVKKVAKKIEKEKKEKVIGVVTHWYDGISVAVIKLSGALKVGDKIKVKRGEEEFEEKIESMQLDHKAIKSGKKGKEIAIKLSGKTKEGAEIFIVK